MYDTTFKANRAESYAGAVLGGDASFVSLRSCTVENNSATTGGGLAFAVNATAAVNDGAVVNNTARADGGGVVADGSSKVRWLIQGIEGCCIRSTWASNKL